MQWVKPLISLMLDGTAGIADYQCRQILGARYHRLAPVFPAGVNIPMDDIKKIPYMIQLRGPCRLINHRPVKRCGWPGVPGDSSRRGLRVVPGVNPGRP